MLKSFKQEVISVWTREVTVEIRWVGTRHPERCYKVGVERTKLTHSLEGQGRIRQPKSLGCSAWVPNRKVVPSLANGRPRERASLRRDMKNQILSTLHLMFRQIIKGSYPAGHESETGDQERMG